MRALALLGGWLLACLLLTVRALPTWDTLVDDAFISGRYAEQFAAGNGLVYNAGEPPIEGYTNLAFTLLIGWERWLGVPMHDALIGTSFGFALLALGAMVLLADAFLERPAPWLALLPAILLSILPHYAVIATNGLETSQFLAASVFALWALWVLPGRWRAISGLLLALLVCIRPEGLLFALGAVLVDLLQHRRDLARPLTWVPLALVVLLVVPLEAWRVATYGDWLPNTAAAKAELTWGKTLWHDLRYLGGDADFWLGLVVLTLVGLTRPGWTWRRVLLIAEALGLVFVASRVILWMPGARLLVLPVALMLPLVVLPLRGLAEGHKGRGRGVWAVVLGAFFVWTAVGNPAWHQQGRDHRHSVVRNNPARLAGEHVARHLPPGSWLATRDAGLLAWSVGPEVSVAELHPRALTQRHPGGEAADWHDFMPENPAFIALTVNESGRALFYYRPEGELWKELTARYRYLGRVEQHYRRHYDLFVRDDIDVPPLDPALVTNFKGALSGATPLRAR